MKSLYKAKSYQEIIKLVFESEKFGRGSLTALAEFMGVNGSFVSNVISGRLDFSLENGLQAAEFLGLNENETEYFLLLISKAKAGTKNLQNRIQKKINEHLEKMEKVQNRIEREPKNLKDEELLEYCSTWHNIAVQMAVRNPDVQNVNDISKVLGLDTEKIRTSLEILERLGFIEVTKNGWKSLQKSLHLSRHQLALKTQHRNWRIEAIKSLDNPKNSNNTDFHYTAVMSLDEKSMLKIKEIILSSIEKCDPVIQESPDEKVFGFNIDLFKVGF